MKPSDAKPVPARRVAVVGLGYVGLPVAVAFARRFPGTIGFDVDREKVRRLLRGEDRTNEVRGEGLRAARLLITADAADLRQSDFFIVAVPTPVDAAKRPDLRSLESASRAVGQALRPGAIVVYESTVYPGVTEELCGPILERESGLRSGQDFFLGYSPERINPGDREHCFRTIKKVVSGQTSETLEVVARCYEAVVDAGVHRAPSIKVAEAAKVIESIQRDLNIALMNELAIIFDRLGIDTKAVLDAAGTKWNFLRFSPGLVGGHCIGVNPYYLATKAEEVGIHPQVILAGRPINDSMGQFVARKTIKLLSLAGRPLQGARVAVLGFTFKENVPDTRNTRVIEVVRELRDYGMDVLVHDPVADAQEAEEYHGISLVPEQALTDVDAVLLAVPHKSLDLLALRLCGAPVAAAGGAASVAAGAGYSRDSGRLAVVAPRVPAVLLDVKSVLPPDKVPGSVRFWRL